MSRFKIVALDGSPNCFTKEDLEVANSLQPVSDIPSLNFNSDYIFELMIIDIDDIVDTHESAETTDQNQSARDTYNPAAGAIEHTIKESGIDLSRISFIVNKGSNGKYSIIDGYGRLTALRNHNFTNALCYIPNKVVKAADVQVISQQSNDHLPQVAITKVDIIWGFLKAVSKGRIPGISTTLADKFHRSDVSPSEEKTYIAAVEVYVKQVGKNNHKIKSIRSMISDITVMAKDMAVSDTMLFMNGERLTNHLIMLYKDFARECDPTSSVNVVLPILNDGTRKAENVFGAIVNKFVEVMKENLKSTLRLNGDNDHRPRDINVVFGMSKWTPQTSFSKMQSIKKTYKMKRVFEEFLKNIQDMVGKRDIFINSSNIPTIGFKGFINPWKVLEKYGWNFQDLITWDEHPSFDDVVILMYNDGLLTKGEMESLIK